MRLGQGGRLLALWEPMMAKRLIHGLEPMLQALRIEQTVSFDECEALFAELFAATGGTPPPFDLSGNQWCALVNLAVARFTTPNAELTGNPGSYCK